MKKLVWIFGLLTIFIQAQITNPIKWKNEIKQLNNNQYEAIFTAYLEPGYHVYSSDIKIAEAIPTTLTFPKNKNIKLIGKVKEVGKKIEEYSEAFKGTLVYYKNQIAYHQKFEIEGEEPVKFSAEVEYQVCNERTCLAPENEAFSFNIKPNKKETDKGAIITKDTAMADVQPAEQTNTPATSISSSKVDKNLLSISSLDINKPINEKCGEDNVAKSGLLWIFVFGFIGGIIALLTPCVYPMIPLTISFFTKSLDKKKGKKQALIYAFFIFLIFVLFTLPFHLISGINPDIFNQISTNVWVNLTFFIIFIIFAISFFGYFEITLPSWMVNKSDKASESGGLIGLFFMALTLVIVSFSCTGPVLGSILANAIQNPMQLTMAFGGCGLAWALVFGGFALFPQLLGNLPKSGGWLNTVKIVLGFVELALALKFLSKADLVAKTFFIKRELFVAIWIIIAFALVLYLLGVIKFPHEDKKTKIGLGRKIWAGIFLIFGIYLIPGLFPSDKPNLKLISGLTPPLNVSYYHNGETCPLGLACVHDYYEALELAKSQNKPILIDFTGYGCENCRKMEEFVWSDPEVLKILNEEVVLASLYVDDPEELPENEQRMIKLKDGRTRKIKTIGNKWSTFQRENFESNSQPQYVLVTPDQRVLVKPLAGYNDKETFLEFLNCGISTYKNLKK